MLVTLKPMLRLSSPVAIPFEVEPQLEDPVGKLATEAVSVRVLPLPVDNLKGNVLVRRAGVEPQNAKVFILGTGLQEVLRGRALVNQIRVENVELVALDDLGRWVVEVVMCLVVFVPLEARVHPVEEARLPGTVLVGPQVHFTRDWELHAELSLVVAHPFLGTPHEGIFGTFTGVTWKQIKTNMSVTFSTVKSLLCCRVSLISPSFPVDPQLLLRNQHLAIVGTINFSSTHTSYWSISLESAQIVATHWELTTVASSCSPC